jgi:hypothetical protein
MVYKIEVGDIIRVKEEFDHYGMIGEVVAGDEYVVSVMFKTYDGGFLWRSFEFDQVELIVKDMPSKFAKEAP